MELIFDELRSLCPTYHTQIKLENSAHAAEMREMRKQLDGLMVTVKQTMNAHQITANTANALDIDHIRIPKKKPTCESNEGKQRLDGRLQNYFSWVKG